MKRCAICDFSSEGVSVALNINDSPWNKKLFSVHAHISTNFTGLPASWQFYSDRGASVNLDGDAQLISYDSFLHVGLSNQSEVNSVNWFTGQGSPKTIKREAAKQAHEILNFKSDFCYSDVANLALLFIALALLLSSKHKATASRWLA